MLHYLKRCLAMASLVALPTVGLSQPVAGKVQPNRINVGTVPVGALVEASVRVLLSGDDVTGLTARTRAPAFAEVRRTELGTQSYGNLGTFVHCDVFLTFDTTTPGDFKEKLDLFVGDQHIEVSLAARVVESGKGSRRVLIAETPFDRFSCDDAALFDPWLRLVERAGLDVSYLEVDRGQPVLRDLHLSSFDVVLLSGEGVFFITDNDFLKLKKFVYGGGRLIVGANHFFQNTVGKANDFVAHYGLELADEEPPAGNNLVQIGPDAIAEHRLTNGVRTLKFFRPSPVAISSKVKGILLVAAPPFPGKGIVALTHAGKGEVVVLGESLWWSWIGNDRTSGADNVRLLENLLSVSLAEEVHAP
jgi:hypothetical protein